MKVLMFSIDGDIMREGSEVSERMKKIGRFTDELHIIVSVQTGVVFARQISPNTYVYSVKSSSKILGLIGAYRLGKEIIRHTKERQNFLITSQDAFTNIPALMLKRVFKVPLEVQIHTDFLSPFFRRESPKNFLRYILYLYSAKRASSVRVVSERIKRSLSERMPEMQDRIYVLPVFVDIQKMQSIPETIDLHKKYSQFDFIILMASRLVREKNIRLALEAFSPIAKKYPKALLLIVGSGSEKNSIQSRIRGLGLSDNAMLESSVPFGVLVSYYKSADLFLASSDYEGYGRTILEAVALRLPVVMTDVGIAGELIINGITGKVVPPRSQSGLSECLFESIQQYPEFQKYADKAGALLLQYAYDEPAYLEALKNAWK